MKTLLNWFRKLWTAEYMVITRGVDGMSGGILYITGNKELKNFIQKANFDSYQNIIKIFRIKTAEPPITVKQKACWYEDKSTIKIGDERYPITNFKNTKPIKITARKRTSKDSSLLINATPCKPE